MASPSVEEDRAAGYRPTVGIILLHYGRVLIGREAGLWSPWWKSTDDELDHLLEIARSEKQWEFGWKLPQGGIELGESAEEAFFREIKEELDPRGNLLVEFSKPELFCHHRQDFPLTRDGVRYRGKSYHYYCAHVQWIDENYDIWVNGPNGDESPSTSCPFAPAFRGGIYFADYVEAQELLMSTHQGRTTTQALRVIHELYERKRIDHKGTGLALTGENWLPGEPIDYPLFEADHPDVHYNSWRTESPKIPDELGEPPLCMWDHPDDYFYKEPPFDFGATLRGLCPGGMTVNGVYKTAEECFPSPA